MLPIFVSIPSNGSSLFQSITSPASLEIFRFVWSQSPQTGQVYFNSIPIFATTCLPRSGLNPLKRVKFISIRPNFRVRIRSNLSLNPLKRVKFISMQYAPTLSPIVLDAVSQSPQTGQVYFNWIQIARILNSHSVSIPSNGSSLFQSNS